MADEFQLGNNNNWWDSSSRTTRFDESAETPSSSATLNNSSSAAASFGWPTEMVDIKAARLMSSVESLSVSGSSIFLSDTPPSSIQESPPRAATDGGCGGGALTDSNLQIMGLGLSSQGMEWNNQPVFRDEKGENSSFRSMLQDGMSSNTYFHHQESVVPSNQDHCWRQKLFADLNNSDDSPSRGFSLDQPYNDTTTDATNFLRVDASATAYGDQSMFQGGLSRSPDSHHQQLQPSSYQSSFSSLDNSEALIKFPQFIVRGSSPPKLQQQQQTVRQLHFSNSTPFWNATAAAMNDVRSSFFPSLQTQLTTPTFGEKQKNISEELRNVNKSSSESEASNKRLRSESSSPLPAFKVRKEKMGDRITALQQLVSPFGKTDTASVLSEAIEYIKFLHEQVNVLSTPYMRSGASLQNQQHPPENKAKDPEAQKQDLRSRGLCLVPVSSTFPVTHETAVDIWTPTFGGTFG